MKLSISSRALRDIHQQLSELYAPDLAAPAGEMHYGGMTGSMSSHLAMSLLERENCVLYLTPDLEEAELIRDDLFLHGLAASVFLLPDPHAGRIDSEFRRREKHSLLLEIIKALQEGQRLVLLGPLQHFAQKILLPSTFAEGLLKIEQGAELPREHLLSQLTDSHYQRVEFIADIGEFAVRGGIVDIYSYGLPEPVRLELDEDRVVSLRTFAPDTQLSLAEVEEVTIMLLPEQEETEQTTSLFDFLPPAVTIVRPERSAVFPPNPRWFDPEIYHDLDSIIDKITSYPEFVLHKGTPAATPQRRFHSHPIPGYLNRVGDLAAQLRRLHGEGYSLHLLCDNNGQQERLEDILESEGIDLATTRFSIGSLQHGFVLDDLRLAVFTDHEIFDRRKPRRLVSRFRKGGFNRSELRRLEPGDHIVHINHGIGVFSGVTRIRVLQHEREVIRIKYAEGDTLYVPVENLDEITKYSGPEGAVPKVHKLGSPEWDRTRKRTKARIQEIAQELIDLYARRKLVQGVGFDPDTVWQKEMEAAFEFDETDDQLDAIVQVKEDMETSAPMDRLICGDVGYGKTEVAIRAAFKAVMNARQVAVLVPTTILAQQHYRTFQERIRPFPLKIEVLSRFRSKAEQSNVLRRLKAGEVDIIVGTHRLLSKDVVFKNLGLLVVDEEQRFGVMHKEKIKQLATQIDCLTMTATPIPRTLHMALMGARDLSNINTPPVNRLPIETTVSVFNKQLIVDAIQQEISRGGQVYFVHNRVQSIFSIKHMLERLLPDLRVAVGHGQMKGSELDSVMLGFMNREYDVLVSTMIIENGLDIPNVNTLIVNRADRQGLSQLYQLRGRIGRSHRQAYAVFLIPPRHSLNRTALKRLDTIEEFSDLGAGFEIARRDLEIRGAGNLLGKAQSGFLTTMGYEMYNCILAEAVAELKGEAGPTRQELTATVQLPRDAFFPGDYISDPTERINLYRQLNEIRSGERLEAYRLELRDRFGPLPVEAELLVLSFNIRLLAHRLGIEQVAVENRGCSFPLPADNDALRGWMQRLSELDHSVNYQLSNAMPPVLSLPLPAAGWLERCRQTIDFLASIPAQVSRPVEKSS